MYNISLDGIEKAMLLSAISEVKLMKLAYYNPKYRKMWHDLKMKIKYSKNELFADKK